MFLRKKKLDSPNISIEFGKIIINKDCRNIDYTVPLHPDQVFAYLAVWKYDADRSYDFINFSRHMRAIPQYDAKSGYRLSAVSSVEKQYKGLVIGGNLRDGIGMSHRITQAANIADRIMNFGL